MLPYQKQILKKQNLADQKFWKTAKDFVPKNIQKKIERLYKSKKQPYQYLLFIEMLS
jgi:hypothetical protein